MKLLRLAEARGVEGVAKVMAHGEITSIPDLRRGLDFSHGTRHKFRVTDYEPSGSSANFKGADSSGPSRKHKYPSENVSRRVRRRLNKRRLNKQPSTLGQVYYGSNKQEKSSLYDANRENHYENCVLSFLVISPAGRVVSEFRSVQELLEVLRDAIPAHQSLYTKGRILHRDISPNNIMITDATKPGDFKGMLIDLNMAKETESGPSGARHRTGTVQFMAIQVLLKADHTYRHDIESFFYVLLWMYARESWLKQFSGEEMPLLIPLRDREVGSFERIARIKKGDVTVNGLEAIVDQFPDVFEVVKPSCMKIRSIVFGDNPYSKVEYWNACRRPGQTLQ